MKYFQTQPDEKHTGPFYGSSTLAGGDMGKRSYLIYTLSDLINKGETENSDTLIKLCV